MRHQINTENAFPGDWEIRSCAIRRNNSAISALSEIYFLKMAEVFRLDVNVTICLIYHTAPTPVSYITVTVILFHLPNKKGGLSTRSAFFYNKLLS